jgi:hypothetical protein
MDSTWDDEQLTASGEDDLTEALADALTNDARFRAAYEEVVLAPLSPADVPRIESVTTQVSFPGQGSRPDMLVALKDGRRVACEHKIRAPETVSATAEGQLSRQLERYLELPDVAAVAYFRPTWREPPDAILFHHRYLHPAGAPHFLWRHLFAPLAAGTAPSAAWLREGFERLGFTPAVPQVGPLVRQVDKENFGKLWDATTKRLFEGWRREHGTHSTLYLSPRTASPVEYVFLNPKPLGGTQLRARVRLAADQGDDALTAVMARLAAHRGRTEAPDTDRDEQPHPAQRSSRDRPRSLALPHAG